MSSRQKRRIARTNGAKSAGTKTPEGLQNSAMNALRYGLTSKTLVLANECPEKFRQLHQIYIDKFQPQDDMENILVDEMVAARWRQQRVWMVQTASLDLQMDKQVEEFNNSPYPVTEPTRIAMAFLGLAKEEKSLELMMRYETSFSRMHDRAMKALFRLREASLPQQASSKQLPQAAEVIEIAQPPRKESRKNEELRNEPKEPIPTTQGTQTEPRTSATGNENFETTPMPQPPSKEIAPNGLNPEPEVNK